MELTKEVLISIVIPVYNSQEFLHRCVDSVLSQSYKTLEVLLINDGSSDSSPEICDDYCKSDSRVKVVHKENGGVSSARNTGIENATGEYLMFIDSDDYIAVDTLEKMTRNIDKSLDYVACSVADCDEELNVFRNTIYQHVNPGIFNSLKEIGKNLYFFQGFSIGKLYKMSIIKEHSVRYHKGFNIGEDSLFVKDYIININSMEIIDESLYYYIHRKNEHLSSNYLENVEEIYRTISESKKRISIRFGLPIESEIVIITMAKIINIFLKNSPYRTSKDRRKFIKSLITNKEFKRDILHFKPIFSIQRILKLAYMTGSAFLIEKCYSYVKFK